MLGWQVKEFGDYRTQLNWTTIEDPKADDDSCVIDVKAAGVMYADLLSIAGKYQMRAPLPFVPGSEAVGVVVEAGPKSRYKAGDRVATINLMGAFAQRMLGLDLSTLPLPDDISFEDGAALTVNYQTAYFALVYRAQTKPGETVLVHGAAGGVGTASIQLAKHLGAKVIATAGSEAKLKICRKCGADHVINYVSDDWVAQIKEITGGKGADVIIDPVGGDVFDASTKCIAFEGRLVVIGFAAGRIPEIAANRVLLKNMSVVGLFWGAYQTRNPELIAKTQHILYDLHKKGIVDPIIYKTFPMSELPQALESIETRQCYGKPIVID